MSLIVQYSRNRNSDVIEGGYNLLEGLREWDFASSRMLGDRAAAQAGGTDVVLLGDSIVAGAGATFVYIDKFGNRLRQWLQARFNPLDIGGGFGFLPAMGLGPSLVNAWASFGGGNYKNGANTVWDYYGRPASYTGEAGDSLGICRRHLSVASTLSGPSQTALWVYGDGMRVNHNYQVNTTAMNLRMTGAQIVYMTNPGDGRFQWQHNAFSGTTPPYVGTPPAIAGGGFGETIDCDAAAAVGVRSNPSDVLINASCTHYIQVDQLDANDRINIEGVILYFRDYKTGVRFHDLSCGGLDSSDYLNATTLAGLARFGERSGATAGQNSTNAKLVIIALGTNDCGNGASPLIDVDTYKANLQTLITSVLAWTSKPSILLLYPPVQNHVNALARWADYIAAGRALARENGIALLDLWAATGNTPHGAGSAGGYWFDRGGYFDGIHYTKLAQDWMARKTFAALTMGGMG